MRSETTTKRIPMQEAARLWSRITGVPRPHRGTLIRWALKGVCGQRLRAERIAGRWYTTPDDVRDFHRVMGSQSEALMLPASATRVAEVQRQLSELDSKIARRSERKPR